MSAVAIVQVSVRFKSGAYVTNTVRGVRASSTDSARSAAQRFAEKYFGGRLRTVTEAPAGADHLVHRFLIEGTQQETA
jgi:hypothetical protein